MNPTRRLTEITIALKGRTPANTVFEPAGSAFFGIEEITAHVAVPTRFVPPGTDLDGAVFLEEGDVVVALLGRIGAAALISTQTSGAVLGRECVALRIATPDIRPAWLCEWFGSDEFRAQAAQHVSGTTMPRLPVKALSQFAISPAPVEDQAALEELANRFDVAIATTTKTLEDLQSLRAAEMQLALESK
jgi:restriction endonuclease S subunit